MRAGGHTPWTGCSKADSNVGTRCCQFDEIRRHLQAFHIASRRGWFSPQGKWEPESHATPWTGCSRSGDSNVGTRCYRVDEIRRHLHGFHFYVQQNPELMGELRARSQDLSPKLDICGCPIGKQLFNWRDAWQCEMVQELYGWLRKDFRSNRPSITNVI